jgi:hypothetical protein
VVQLGVVARICVVVGILGLGALRGEAGTVTFDNGVTGVGYTAISPDDFGTYGFLIGQQYDDEFYPPGVANPFSPTYLTGPELYITTQGTATSSILLTEYKFWHDLVEGPPQPDGIVADPAHIGLARTITSAIAMTGTNEATSAFSITTDPTVGIKLDFTLVQRLSSDAVAMTSQFDQIYTVTNHGAVPVDLVFHLAWDPDLYYNPSNQETDDVVGVGAGLCGVYMHDGDPRWSVALGNGPTSTVPVSYYFGGKEGVVPGTGPAFAPISAPIAQQWIWIDHGMPGEWRNFVVGPGKNAVGESDPALVADATMGIEYRLTLAVNDSATIHIRRYYGTTSIPCYVSAACGNGTLDAGELCDGADTPTCNGKTCAAGICGDGYPNMMAGEQCDSSGVDSPTCDGATCTMPACGDGHANLEAGELCDDGGDTAACNADCTIPRCGDGHVNVAAAEECESGELCDLSTCTYQFSLGGGCTGCGASDPGALSLLACLTFGLVRRRRRRPRAAAHAG